MHSRTSYDLSTGPDCQLRWQDRADIEFATSYDVERELLFEQFDSTTAQLMAEQHVDFELFAQLFGEAK